MARWNKALALLRGAMRRDSGSGPDLRAIFADEHLRVTQLGDEAAPGLFVCFTGIRQAMGGIDAEEFVGSTAIPGFSALFVSDLKRSWYNSFPPEQLLSILAPRAAGRRVVTLGNSMGGFGAIWATTILPVDTAIAFAPQFSVHPDIMPGETRWQEYTRAIGRFRHPSLADAFDSGARIDTVNGDDDQAHWSLLPDRPRCEHVLVSGSGHDPALAVKQSGALPDLLRACLEGQSALAVLQGAALAASRV